MANDRGTSDPMFLYSGSVTGPVLTATYTNLKNSYVIKNGVKVPIGKLVRQFSNLSSLVTPSTVNFWKSASSGLTNSQYHLTMLSPTADPWYGGNFRNATSVTVSDKFYDSKGNQIDPTGGYYIIGSLNYTGTGDHESVKGTNTQPYAIAGSSINVQPDGSLMANRSNEVHLSDNGLKETYTPGSNNWDGKDSAYSNGKYLYYGAGVLRITNSSPALTFTTSADNASDNIGAQWFQLTTDLISTPVQRKTTQTHYHYDVIAKRYLSRTISIER